MDTVHECDRQTDRRTDRRTDRITITDTVQTASHGKNCSDYHARDSIGDGVLFSIDFFVSLSARLREKGLTDLHDIFREGVE